MSRRGSMTRPTPLSVSATRKLVLPSSPAGTASTVYMSLRQRDRHCREEDPDGDQRDDNRPAVEDGLRRHTLGCMHAEVHEEITQPMREMEERHRDQHQEVKLDDRVAEHRHPCVVMAVDNRHDAERTEDALDEDMHGDEHRGYHATLREQEPPDEVHIGRTAPHLGAHRANQIRTNPTTADAT